ncbi:MULTISPECIES: nuclear transport factor 2 family protein [unclassified Undibacterium]|uniref:nuclear transport factor 2 family protein n=1 Tax=unclassified Undibacterium TaxID=2630295 RepID=UPI002AC95749|nr:MULTISPECIES: nuclear transport factor 2 family protein [unclassified Undibacterium]MEB0138994.1 nuclear transport factor 2 family protein [Undibacterium sp. CCC2.1]MEB0171911.1 nuclear transport factor 2 family protein [Undibacterium sp. CCC1.1]MEB0175852.1 nuclear transport factor 2 family protein [Undibacterium sp. CCC3.4]MEB0215082.1 nuclear transport factor 2 family protein [Undibacterium sp. 5I2]WPX45052.1 nuclear transport factor 2 family protein [Undibacterium sp. CCC3.4]
MSSLHPQVSVSLQRWHDMISQNDLSALAEIVHPDAVFRSPMAHQPYTSAAAVVLILSTVCQVFEDFHYEREFIDPDGCQVALEFSARVGQKQIKGIDLIRFDVAGKITDFEVMVRPLSGLQALGQAMSTRLAAYLPAYTAR